MSLLSFESLDIRPKMQSSFTKKTRENSNIVLFNGSTTYILLEFSNLNSWRAFQRSTIINMGSLQGFKKSLKSNSKWFTLKSFTLFGLQDGATLHN